MFHNQEPYDYPMMPMYSSMPGIPFMSMSMPPMPMVPGAPVPRPGVPAPPMPTTPGVPLFPIPPVPATPVPPMPTAPDSYVSPQLPPDFEIEPGAPVQKDILYTQGYMRTQIGRYVKIEFLIGTNMLIDREGTLKDVGISYVIIQEPETDDLVLCDIYSIKFVKFFY